MITPIAIPMTVRGLTLIPFSFSVSKYLISPAEDWKLLSFFFAMGFPNRRLIFIADGRLLDFPRPKSTFILSLYDAPIVCTGLT